MSEDSEFVMVKSKRGKRNKKSHNITDDNIQNNTIDPVEIKKKLKESMCILKISDFFQDIKGLVGTKQIDDVVCYGIGNFAECCIARYQLALLLLLREDLLKVPINRCNFYDPKMTESEKLYLKDIGCNVISINEEGKRSVTDKTLFYMPHCGKSLYNNLLWSNWTPEKLSKCIIIGNSFHNIVERNTKRKLEKCCWYLYNISPHVSEEDFPENFQYTDIFNDTSIITFPESSIQEVKEELWEHLEEPKYDDDDLEFIRNK